MVDFSVFNWQLDGSNNNQYLDLSVCLLGSDWLNAEGVSAKLRQEFPVWMPVADQKLDVSTDLMTDICGIHAESEQHNRRESIFRRFV